MTKSRADRLSRLPANLAPRGLSREEAATYIGISPGKFDKMVDDGLMPKPKPIGGRRVWDLRKLDSYFDALPDTDGDRDSLGDIWDRAAV
ncbi:hypothetical protein Hden_1527 [Hyphomicrobium denitrificans ATCC 51888]|uniref:Helix-turn-helix domain-containing protein n=1 Tax=Hyphomicrobium denitrificans (strain ATCC 51888 / DSM 1869 / NCIMB 11706 / TK 0415) TaxID=582899 RepID=D8JQ13_HYPDA|nr:hypothetical protein [Hyphomicrobium denitrificans]ADJ21934.1 hypothetical protein Hden_0107 [Hyphomicrobium denitrificans ATCC 51888]ADJ23339.1 hypothetical protein Hden_1527 [Hyphomicrobium denitrificans ATCC 51888]